MRAFGEVTVGMKLRCPKEDREEKEEDKTEGRTAALTDSGPPGWQAQSQPQCTL